jgi:hypothetical protein
MPADMVFKASVISSRLGSPTNQLTHAIIVDNIKPGTVDSLQ